MTLKRSKISLLLTFALAAGSAPAFAASAPGVASGPSDGHAVPAALRPALYKALAKDAGPAHAVNGAGCASLPGQKLTACFDNGGAHFSGAASLTLRLVAYGRAGARQPLEVKPVRPAVSGNEVTYDHGNLDEWWRVLPVGFEQGFTVTKRPAGDGDLTLAMAASGKTAQLGGALAWGKLRYGGLVVTDANGRIVPATLTSRNDRILIAVNDAHAAYPLTVDPLVWMAQKVVADDGAAFAQFGMSAAISGATALIGSDATIDGKVAQGAVYVFTKSNGTWTQTQTLTSGDGEQYDNFGWSIALDGTTALIGANCAHYDPTTFECGPGAAYIFTESDGVWSEAQEITASDGASYDSFGQSVALDGSTALVGAISAAVNGNLGQGAAYVFTQSDGIWTQTQKLTASDGEANAAFGAGGALEGSTALVGAPFATVGGNEGQGAVYVFNESGGTWTQIQKLTASDGATYDEFGSAIAIEGTTTLIGSPAADVNGNAGEGAVYEFTQSGGSWRQAQKLVPDNGEADEVFGWAISLDGSNALIAAPGITFTTDNPGAAYVFGKSNGAWAQVQKLAASDGVPADNFGWAVAFDGATALVGSYHAAIEGNFEQGAAYFYGESSLGLALSAPETVGQNQEYVSQTIATNNGSAASPAVTATVTVPAAASFVSATATQGDCSEASGVVTCDFGAIDGNAGTATANVTLKATGNVGDTIENVAGIAKATPSLSASAPTTITADGACPDGYAEYDGSLNPGEVARSPVYQTPGGGENAILTAPERFQLYAVYQSGRYGRHVYLVPGNEVHRWGPKGLYMWLVRARDGAGAYTLCLQHP